MNRLGHKRQENVEESDFLETPVCCATGDCSGAVKCSNGKCWTLCDLFSLPNPKKEILVYNK